MLGECAMFMRQLARNYKKITWNNAISGFVAFHLSVCAIEGGVRPPASLLFPAYYQLGAVQRALLASCDSMNNIMLSAAGLWHLHTDCVVHATTRRCRQVLKKSGPDTGEKEATHKSRL